MTGTFLTGAALLVDGAWVHGHGLLLDGGVVAGIYPSGAETAAIRITLPPGALLVPGLIDIQVNGGGGLLFNDAPTQATARAIAAAHRRCGTTAILPTLITDTPACMRQAASVLAEPDAGLLGLHFEGPFLSTARPGVHPPHLIRVPREDDLARLETLGARQPGRIVLTLAPESVSDAQIRRLAAAGIIICAGHTAASYDRTAAAIAAGLSGFTHLFNAMPPPESRAPGVAGAALTDPHTWCGVIADGIHVHPAMLRLLLAAKPARTLLVSDSMPPIGTTLTSFGLQGREIYRQNGSLRTADGTLAGADICLADAVRFCVRTLGIQAAHALEMASAAPADFLGIGSEVGRLAAGLRADLLLLTPTLDVLGTWVSGAWQGQAGIVPAQAAA